MKVIAYTVKGLEEIAKEEIKDLVQNSSFIDTNSKRIVIDANDTNELTKLKTVDDICLLLGEGGAINIDDVLNAFENIDLKAAKQHLEQYRAVNDTFSITFS